MFFLQNYHHYELNTIFYLFPFYVMGKALSGELSCTCDRSCLKDYKNLTPNSPYEMNACHYQHQ